MNRLAFLRVFRPEQLLGEWIEGCMLSRDLAGRGPWADFGKLLFASAANSTYLKQAAQPFLDVLLNEVRARVFTLQPAKRSP
jgi:hypothetical protein